MLAYWFPDLKATHNSPQCIWLQKMRALRIKEGNTGRISDVHGNQHGDMNSLAFYTLDKSWRMQRADDAGCDFKPWLWSKLNHSWATSEQDAEYATRGCKYHHRLNLAEQSCQHVWVDQQRGGVCTQEHSWFMFRDSHSRLLPRLFPRVAVLGQVFKCQCAAAEVCIYNSGFKIRDFSSVWGFLKFSLSLYF